MKLHICILALLLALGADLCAQRRVPAKSKEQKAAERQAGKREKQKQVSDTEPRWDTRKLPGKSKGVPEISAWHTGTAGIIPSDAAEISLFNASRIGFSRKTELLFRIAEEPFLPNAGLKHQWWSNRRFALSTEHTLYYTWTGLKILQKTGFKDLVPDSVRINHSIAMRHEILFSWLMNPTVWGCPNPSAEKILTLRLGTELGIRFGDTEIRSFDYFHSLYHTQLLEGKVLYYGGLQFDSYFGSRFHYSLNALMYSVDLKKEYAAEANLRLTCYVSRRVGISASCKAAYMNIGDKTQFTCLPLLDLTYLVNPGRGTIRHGLQRKLKAKGYRQKAN